MVSQLTLEELVREFDQPNLTGWKLFVQLPDLTIYRQIHQKIFYYKCITHLPDVSPEIFYKVALDVEYRVIWDKYLKEGKRINDGKKQGVYWQITMPLFIDNRDYTFVQESSEYDIDNRHFYYIATRSEKFENEPPRKKVVRIEDCQSQALLCSDGANGLKSIFLYHEDPRGNFPKSVWSWAAKFGIPLLAKLTHNACKAYPAWLKDRKTELTSVLDNGIDDAAAEAAAAAAVIKSTSNPADNNIDDDDNNCEQKEEEFLPN